MTLKHFLLHVSIHALKDLHMINHGTIIRTVPIKKVLVARLNKPRIHFINSIFIVVTF